MATNKNRPKQAVQKEKPATNQPAVAHDRPPADIQSMLHDYQRLARNFLILTPKAGLFLDVGFGKTLVTLATLQELARQGAISGHILLIAPKPIARSTWTKEIQKWGLSVRTQSFIVNERGTQLSRKKRLLLYDQIQSSPPTFYFINKELVSDLVDYHKEWKKPWPFPTIVIDELQGFKSHDAIRFKKLKSVMPQVKRFIGLTGTPVPNGLMDLWAEIFLMDSGKRLGTTITSYREKYFNTGLQVNGYTVSWRPKTNAEKQIYSAVGDIVMSIKNPGLKLPDITYHDAIVYMDQKEMDVYREFARESVMKVQHHDGSILDITAANAAVLSGKLSQLASGTIYTGNGKDYAVLHRHKLEMLQYIIENTTTPVMVAYHFQSDLSEIQAWLKEQLGIDAPVMDGTPGMIDLWNSDKIPVLLMQPASTGHGLNLQEGSGHTLTWYTVPTSLEQYIQTVGRLHRQGQKNPVMVHHLLTDGTIDRKLLDNLVKKDCSEEALKSAVARTLDGIL